MRSNQGFRLYRRSLLMENKWRAARYGIDGKLIDFGKQMEVPERELIEEYLAFVDDVLDELGSREEVEYIRDDHEERHRRRPPAAGLPRNRRHESGGGLHHRGDARPA